MFRKLVSLFVLVTFLNGIVSCTKSVKLYQEDLSKKSEKIVEVVFPSGDVVRFDQNGGKYIPVKRIIAGVTDIGNYREINVDDILYARVSRTNVAGTILTTVGVLALGLAVLFVIALATKESCPFVYSYDGEKFVFDAEPYGGAICQGLKKTDYSRLEHLKAVDGNYYLMLRNEVEETQYTDEMKLLIVDHTKSSEIMPDEKGNMYIIEKPISPFSALDEKGMDLTKFISRTDNIAWQSSLPVDTSYKGRNLRHQLSFKFPKPPDASSAYLLVNIGTGLWGSNMIREMLELRGNQVDTWYAGVNNGGLELKELFDFIEREELYLLKLYLKEGNAWVQHGFIPGGGPFINEDRVVTLNLAGVVGDTVEIKLNPPMGFWALDYIAITYQANITQVVQEVAVDKAEDQDKKDVSELLFATDNSYQVLDKVGDWVKLSFNAPPQQRGTNRSIFLRTSGYYEIHLPKDKPEQAELIHEFFATPGFITQYAMDEYIKWRSMQSGEN